MCMTEFTISGRWQSRDSWETFEKTLEAPNEDVAREHTYSEFGSKHGLKRTQVEIEEVGA
jgi:large subunit ribosomal protein LX